MTDHAALIAKARGPAFIGDHWIRNENSIALADALERAEAACREVIASLEPALVDGGDRSSTVDRWIHDALAAARKGIGE